MIESADLVRENYEGFFRQHYEKLCSYAYTFLKDEESCEDLVQDVFIRIWEQRQDLIGSDQLKFYSFTAVRNNCLTWLQKNKKHSVVALQDQDAAEEITVRLDPADATKDPQALIAKAMEQLPPKCREVFMLSRLSHQTYQQIADSLGISIKTVENQMGKAIRILRLFAKENHIYPLILLCLAGGNFLVQTIGVHLKNWFY